MIGLYQNFVLHEQRLPRELIPDYNASVPFVLSQATRLAIKELKRLDPLLYVCHGIALGSGDDTMPTWVPNWH